jgi:hypothetical protein
LLLLKGDDENYNVNNNNNRINDNSNGKNDGIHLNSFKDTRLSEDQMQGGIKQMNSISNNSNNDSNNTNNHNLINNNNNNYYYYKTYFYGFEIQVKTEFQIK